jgi:cytochrome b561
MKYDRTIRWLHAGLALTVLIQLFCSLFMEVTRPARIPTEPGHALFQIHQWSGISVAGLLLIHWLWQLAGHVTNGWGHLFPWYSRNHMRQLVSDLKTLPNWIRNGFPDQRVETLPLAGAVHGLGLLSVSAMALTGATIFFAMAPDGGLSPFVMHIADVHGFVANFVWVYVFGHAGMALYHQLSGSPLISDMFNLVRK